MSRFYFFMALFLIVGLVSGFLASYAIYQPQIQNLQTQLQEQQKHNENLKTQVLNLQTENKEIKAQLAEYQFKEYLRKYYKFLRTSGMKPSEIFERLIIKYGEENVKKYWEEISGIKIFTTKEGQLTWLEEEEEGKGWEGSGGGLIFLIVYYQELKAKGLTDQQILEIFLKEGWSEELLKVNWPTISGHKWENNN